MANPNYPNGPYGNPYGGQPPYPPPYPVSRPTNGLAIASLIVSLAAAFVTCGCAAPIGAILGHAAQKQIRASGGAQGGEGMALAGIIIGWIATALMLLWVIVGVVLPILGFGGLALFGGLAGAAGSGSN